MRIFTALKGSEPCFAGAKQAMTNNCRTIERPPEKQGFDWLPEQLYFAETI
jgi:hypothetical protein